MDKKITNAKNFITFSANILQIFYFAVNSIPVFVFIDDRATAVKRTNFLNYVMKIVYALTIINIFDYMLAYVHLPKDIRYIFVTFTN